MILGLDVSSVATGYCVMNNTGDLIDYGVIRPKSKIYENRLQEIYHRLRNIISTYHEVDDAYIESVFTCKNANTTIKLAQVRGVAILACMDKGIAIHDVAPTLVKKHLGNAKADKKYIIEKINSLYDLSITDDNIADAIAISRYGYERKKHAL